MSFSTLIEPLLPLWKTWSLGQILSATSCRWALQKQTCINSSPSLKSWMSNLFLHWMVLSFMPVSIWSCICATILRQLFRYELNKYLPTSHISNLEPLESETEKKLLLLLLLVLILLWYLSLKLESLLLLLSLTRPSSDAEAHMADTLLELKDRAPVAKWHDKVLVCNNKSYLF